MSQNISFEIGDLVYLTYPFSHIRSGDAPMIEKKKRFGIVISILSEQIYQVCEIENNYEYCAYNTDYMLATEK